MKLSELHTGDKGIIVKVMGRGAFRKRIIEMGFIKGKEVRVVQNAPLRDPIHYNIMGYDVSLRRNDAALVEVVCATDKEALSATQTDDNHPAAPYVQAAQDKYLSDLAIEKSKTINIALVGNPNCGKTSLFNFASGRHEHVGNYSGVTVDAQDAIFHQAGYTFKIVDLPGTYSLSAYTPEELFVRRHLQEAMPDVVVNVVDASNLERNLYLTSQLIDMDARTVIALNMYDELLQSKDQFDHEGLAKMIGIPIVPTNGRNGKGISELFQHVIDVYEEQDPILRHVHINYGKVLEKGIQAVRIALKENGVADTNISCRHLAVKLLENDKEIEKQLSPLPLSEKIFSARDAEAAQIAEFMKTDSETAFTDARYGFIAGALKDTYIHNEETNHWTLTKQIDRFATNKYLGLPIFIFLMWLMFKVTFDLGQYPMDMIEEGVGLIGKFVQSYLPEGMLKDLIVDGIIGGVGGVIVFLPNIVILYAFISFMEDSGYMSRAAFIMDKLMHKMGLHGKSFIPLVMGFGCTVPAIMATRTIESRNSRMLTILVSPLMSCSARLPVYVLLAGAFFPEDASTVMMMLYVLGVLLAMGLARLFKRFLFKGEDIPFVMELPPYRMPTLKSILIHMWEKAKQYLQKMGGIILLASIIIWFLGYFPRPTEQMTAQEQQEQSYIGKIGKGIQPALAPLGFDWKMSISLLTGMAAKEVVVSTLGVLHNYDIEEGDEGLQQRLVSAVDKSGNKEFSALTALCLMIFVLIYFPCIATVTAVARETKSALWGLFVVGYTIALAWIVSFATYQLGSLFSILQ